MAKDRMLILHFVDGNKLSFDFPEQTGIAAGNAPIEHDEVLPDGRRRVRFAPTSPIPSYLFAFAVGPLDRKSVV